MTRLLELADGVPTREIELCADRQYVLVGTLALMQYAGSSRLDLTTVGDPESFEEDA